MASTVYTDEPQPFQVQKELKCKGNTKARFPRPDGRIIAKGNILEGIEAKT